MKRIFILMTLILMACSQPESGEKFEFQIKVGQPAFDPTQKYDPGACTKDGPPSGYAIIDSKHNFTKNTTELKIDNESTVITLA